MIGFQNFFNKELNKKEQKYIDSIFEKMKDEKDGGRIGYYTVPNNKKELLKEIESYINSNKLLKDSKIENVVVIGIGGSSLGAKAINRLLYYKSKKKSIKLHFLENCDPINLTQSMEGFRGDNSIFVLISKSGSTIETTSIFKYIYRECKFDFNDKSIKDRLIVITDRGSPLSKFAKKYQIVEFNIPENVGGRFSVLTHVGLVPLAIAGFNVEKLLDGAKNFENHFFEREEMHLLTKALFYTQNTNKFVTNVLFSYSSQFEYFNNWYVQLWGESLGKLDISGKSVGLTPIGITGSIDQHSFLQLIMEGPADKTLTFLKIDNFENELKIPDVSLDFLEKTNFVNSESFGTLINAQCESTMEAILERTKIPVDLIKFDKLNHRNVGALIYYYELLTSAMGLMLNINTYDQPGVELGKVKLVNKFKKDK